MGNLSGVEIIRKYLIDNEYGGLYYLEESGSCACELSRLMHCHENAAQCKAGYKIGSRLQGKFMISSDLISAEEFAREIHQTIYNPVKSGCGNYRYLKPLCRATVHLMKTGHIVRIERT